LNLAAIIILCIAFVIQLAAILIMVRAVFILKKVRFVANQILANDKAMKDNLQKLVAKTIARTVAIMNSKDEDAKAKLREMISEE